MNGTIKLIRQTARKQKSPGYAKHLEYCRQCWKERSGVDDYVPALIGGDSGFGVYDDWDKPRFMERRAELRALPEIQSLLPSVG